MPGDIALNHLHYQFKRLVRNEFIRHKEITGLGLSFDIDNFWVHASFECCTVFCTITLSKKKDKPNCAGKYFLQISDQAMGWYEDLWYAIEKAKILSSAAFRAKASGLMPGLKAFALNQDRSK